MSELYDISKLWQDWETVRLIGEGSFGKVYDIVHNRLGVEEHCALKVISIPTHPAEIETLRNDGMDDKSVTLYYRGLVEEMVQEIALMKKLRDNNNIVRYEDFYVVEHEDDLGWDIIIRMELLKATSLHFRDNALTVEDVLHLGIDMCKALEECETHKIIHRDIKPDNIFVSENGTYKLGDFGVARTIDRTMSGLSKKGTYTYMAPEVYKGEEYGKSVDIYSLGIVMYKLLNNNREPFLPPYPQAIQYSDKSNALVYRMSGRDIPPIAGIDERLNSVILKACAYESEDRHRSASQLKADLQNILDTLNEKGEALTSEEVLEDKTDKTVSVFDFNRFETSVKEDVAEDNKAETVEAERAKEVDAVSEKEPSVHIEQEEEKEGTVSIFGKAPIPSQRPAEISEQKALEKKSNDIAEKIPETAKEETKEKKKPKWWIFLIAALGVVIVAVIIVLAVSFTSNNSAIIDTEDSNNIGSENNIIYENNNDYIPNDNVEDFTVIMEEEFDTQKYFEEPTTIYEYNESEEYSQEGEYFTEDYNVIIEDEPTSIYEYTESEEFPQEMNYITEDDLLGEWIEGSSDQSYYFHNEEGILYYYKYDGNLHSVGVVNLDDSADCVYISSNLYLYLENGVLEEYDYHTGEWLGSYYKQ